MEALFSVMILLAFYTLSAECQLVKKDAVIML